MRKRSLIRRAIDAERRLGPPVNEFATRMYDWLFTVLGPCTIAFGALLVWDNYVLDGLILLALGAWMTVMGYRRAWRWFRHRSERSRT